MSGAPVLPRHHPDEATLLAHVAGHLGEAHRLLIATHLAGCARCRGDVAAIGAAAGELLLGLPAAAEPVDLAGILSRLDAAPRPDLPPGSPGGSPARAPAAPTVAGVTLPDTLREVSPGRVRCLGPGIRHARLLRNRHGTLHLLRVRSGVSLPQHAHRGLELTCVLSGAFAEDGRDFAAGDVSEASDETEHAPVALGVTDCVCIISSDAPIRFRGWLGRLAQPFLPF